MYFICRLKVFLVCRKKIFEFNVTVKHYVGFGVSVLHMVTLYVFSYLRVVVVVMPWKLCRFAVVLIYCYIFIITGLCYNMPGEHTFIAQSITSTRNIPKVLVPFIKYNSLHISESASKTLYIFMKK